ncbi:OLC1v1023195C1 [Oldenlandia corymbosa var. corymbosa]|uniref:OLC1v1023195C1 n=1 Tax=Oldenlandia corymbosa var. corymbosa TaxID=529605 RepID=A0AAV1BZS2_OLDCO|nr:OLC1v1023195C1 [Oldenlandia corymbosa var. corymbosa]
MTKEYAQEFLEEVERVLLPTNHVDNKYTQFRSALKMFQNRTLSVEGVVDMFNKLFEGHQGLLLGLRNFLPQIHNHHQQQQQQQQQSQQNVVDSTLISSSSDDDDDEVSNGPPTEEYVEIRSREFFNSVKDRFANNNVKIYYDVMNVLNSYSKGKLDATTSVVYTKICSLLLGHVDLVQQFESFLDDGTGGLIDTLRYLAREDCLSDYNVLLKRYESATEAIKEKPEELTEDNLVCMAELYFSEYHNENVDKRVRYEFRWVLFKEINYDLKGVSNVVIPLLEKKIKELVGKRDEVKAFFDKILDLPAQASEKEEDLIGELNISSSSESESLELNSWNLRQLMNLGNLDKWDYIQKQGVVQAGNEPNNVALSPLSSVQVKTQTEDNKNKADGREDVVPSEKHIFPEALH